MYKRRNYGRRPNPYNVRRRRGPVRRRGYRPKRTYRRSARRSTGNIIVNARAAQIVTLGTTATHLQLAPSINDFPEYNELAKSFQNYKMLNCAISIVPLMTQTELDNPCEPYNVAPWKRHISATLLTDANMLTIDKNKQYRCNRSCYRKFKPAISVTAAVVDQGTGDANLSNSVIKYSPQIEIVDDKSLKINHYCCVIQFPAVTANGVMQYKITTTCKTKFSGQKLTALI
ncbi:capsid protein [robinz virus RP_259]|uniref:Capsid protein n=1 Tax=robinz virus RP_259 TaxID=2886397 RepID=A0A8K1UF75_9CIRC|nr:capsid protein [robinz virus RP_259]UDN67407.1 capsid protein [robinz virus RP_259]UDN67419.1 capsid protein [robinz virus RP_954]